MSVNPETSDRMRCTYILLPLLDSEEERIAVETASRYGSKPDVYSTPVAEDVSVEVKVDGEGPRVGADAQLKILVKNLSSQSRQATIHSQVAVMYYTGVLKGTIKKEQMPVELSPNEGWISSSIMKLHYLCRVLVLVVIVKTSSVQFDVKLATSRPS